MELTRNCTRVIFGLSLLCSALEFAMADPLSDISDPEIRECLQRTLPKLSAQQEIVIRVFEQDALISMAAGKLLLKKFADGRFRAVMRLSDPPQKRDVALLVEQPEDESQDQSMIMYLPELRTTRRIVGSALAGSMFDSGISYNDFMHLYGLRSERKTQRLADVVIEERQNYVIEVTPTNEQSEYSKVVNYVDQQWCIPIQTHFYNNDEVLVKELAVDPTSVRAIGDRFVPHRSTMHDRENGTHTDIEVSDVELDAKISDLKFSQSALARGR